LWRIRRGSRRRTVGVGGEGDGGRGARCMRTLFPDQPQEMVSVYTVDGPGPGDDALLHAGQSAADERRSRNRWLGTRFSLKFAGGGNLDPKKDKHMHAATLTIVDADHIEIDGIGWENWGTDEEMCGQMKLE